MVRKIPGEDKKTSMDKKIPREDKKTKVVRKEIGIKLGNEHAIEL